jgi:dockerin type I repeat protein
MDAPMPNLDPPPSLGRELRRVYRSGVAVPGERDEAVLAAARGRAGVIRARRARGRVLARLGAVAGLAAAVAVAAVVWPRGGGTRNGPAVPGQGGRTPFAQSGEGRGTDPRDVNGDGVVDILDAFAVARAVEGGASEEERRVRAAGRAPMGWDFNGDGVVDRRDAESIAVSVVRLGPPAGRG